MFVRTPHFRRPKRAVLSLLTVCAALAAVLLGGRAPSAGAAGSLPCDVYGGAGTPCVAAHSLARALYGSYGGPLYQVRRASDGATANIGLLATGGYADAAAQDSFCSGTTCVITTIYDQSPRHNDLTVEGPGGAGAADVAAPADALPVTVGGHQAYGLEISAGMGYRDNSTSGVAVNGQPEGMYMVTSGAHVNGACCFDYGNAETNTRDNGNGHMDALNFGTECWFQPCYGAGPWVQADLENGLFQSNAGHSTNTANTGTGPLPFVTALLKNNGRDHFALKHGNAQSGGLTTTYSGGEPTTPGYSPMRQEGAIVLGTGGDNSNGSIGSFFEGVMTAGIPSDAADDAVQSNIVSVGYGGPTGSSGTLNPASEISLRATTACCTTEYVRHRDGQVVTSPISSGSSALDKNDATWVVRRGLANRSCVSFESRNYPGDFLRHYDFKLLRQPMDGSAQFRADATFCPESGKSGAGTTSFNSYNFPGKYLRHYNHTLYIASDGGSNAWDATASWAADVSWAVSSPWAP
ncbi:alpha-L-arabinofuranosidase B [Streptomyces sp. NPDC046985]|uniref:alpha-L-arabinofuranosidase B n=1 Tax=Streptomyces sp. NPDC046985 TaxID=3155377 RepID=UPI0033C85D1F